MHEILFFPSLNYSFFLRCGPQTSVCLIVSVCAYESPTVVVLQWRDSLNLSCFSTILVGCFLTVFQALLNLFQGKASITPPLVKCSLRISYPQVQVALALCRSLHLQKSSFVLLGNSVVKNYALWVKSIRFKDEYLPFLGPVAWIYLHGFISFVEWSN